MSKWCKYPITKWLKNARRFALKIIVPLFSQNQFMLNWNYKGTDLRALLAPFIRLQFFVILASSKIYGIRITSLLIFPMVNYSTWMGQNCPGVAAGKSRQIVFKNKYKRLYYFIIFLWNLSLSSSNQCGIELVFWLLYYWTSNRQRVRDCTHLYLKETAQALRYPW